MSKPSILKVPYLGTAEEDVLLAEWFVAEGEAFRKGEAVAAVETLKAAFEVEAERDGVLLRRIVQAGVRVALQAPIGVIATRGESVDDAAIDALVAEAEAASGTACAVVVDESIPAATAGTAAGAAGGQAAPAARRRARELDVDLDRVRGTGPDGLVRLEDVEAAALGKTADRAADGRVDPDFVAHLRRDRAAFAALDSDFKVALYRNHGAILGPGAQFAPGAVLIAEVVVLGDHAYFGANTEFEARELRAGEYLHFGRDCRVRCTTIRCGDNAFFTDDIEIGGGGAFEPEAELVVGSHGFVGEHVHLNPCRKLELGDEVVISRNAVIMTHSFGGSILRGYPNRFAGVKIGSFAQVGIQATLFPGVEVGEGAILLSGSSLVSSVPPGRMFGGVPAVDMKSAAQPLDDAAFAHIAQNLIVEFARQLQLRGRTVDVAEGGEELAVQVVDEGRTHTLRFAAGAPFAELAHTVAEEVRCSAQVADADWSRASSDVVTIDLSVPRITGPAGPLADAFREFLRKRGVRLRPRSWAYKGGWL